MSTTKPYEISRHLVWEAYKSVGANGGAAGIDGQTISGFEKDLKNNLYKLWNRMSSGSYFPSRVKRVEIPKATGGTRGLGIPTVQDRIAQMVVKKVLEPLVEPLFHGDSYGYRPGKSAHQAVGVARQRCWRYNYVLDIDIKGFFDNIDHTLLMKAVRKHTPCKWVLLYIERWLQAPVQHGNGEVVHPGKGIPQGGVISPLLANLYLHYTFDSWMVRNYQEVPFERYADDIIIHVRSEQEAEELQSNLATRLQQCHLELHPEKTKIVYCKDADRRKDYPTTSFVFLGYEFRPRGARNKWGKLFCNFLPAVSRKALTTMQGTVRAWRLKWCCEKSLEDLSRMFNPIARGWIQYFGKYYKSGLFSLAEHLNQHLRKWVMIKYKRYRRKPRKAMHALGKMARAKPYLFAHWQVLGYLPADGTRRAV